MAEVETGAAEAAVHGTVAEGYEPVRDAFVRNFGARGESGAALAVHRHGRKVVDLWGGVTDPENPASPTSQPWREDTAVVLHSATKGPAAAVLHLLHQRGQLDLDAPVGTYWPEFKANGKDRVLVRQLLSHRGGVPVLDTPLTPDQAVDGVSGPRALEAQAPEWLPGTAHGYHPHTYSWLLAELVRRVTGGGRTIGSWFADEIARPLGLDLWLGLPGAQAAEAAADAARVARIAYVPTPEPEPGGLRLRPRQSVVDAYADPASLTRRAFGAIDPAADENAPAYRAAGLPGSAGIGTARALSRFYAALIGPLPDGGPRLFTPATLTQARSEESAGSDRVLMVNTRFGLGFMLHGPAAPMLGPGSFGHPGRGGSLGFADPESGISFAYVTGTMHKSVTNDPRPQAVLRALRTAAPQSFRSP